MYTVSDAYKTAIAAPTRKCEWRGTLTLSTGAVTEITPDMIATGSGGITASCCGVPRMCGGDPKPGELPRYAHECSPHVRG